MVENITATAKLNQIRVLVRTAKLHTQLASDGSSVGVQYFSNGEYAKDCWKLIQLIDELDSLLGNGAELPIYWQKREESGRRIHVILANIGNNGNGVVEAVFAHEDDAERHSTMGDMHVVTCVITEPGQDVIYAEGYGE